ncbi:hypothetical protein JW992_07150, partial [candidate division KSB1 bacterium]|nr:hypothetical protein [candidate division KSB1 bacterium]
LVEFAFVSAWLKAGGSLIAIPLQYPKTELIHTAMKELYNIDLKNYQSKVAFIQFDPLADIKNISEDTVAANMVNPEIWDKAIQQAEKRVETSDLGILVFASALNLLLFSPKYKKENLERLADLIKNDKSKTYAFAASTSAFPREIERLEDAADNLMFTRMEEPMKLFFRIARMKNVPFSDKEVTVPIPQGMLETIKKVAEATRKRQIPEIRKI